MLLEKKSVALKQLTMYQYAGGYYRVPYESNKKEEQKKGQEVKERVSAHSSTPDMSDEVSCAKEG